MKLRQVEVLLGQRMPWIDAIRQINVTEQLSELERIDKNNERFRQAASDLALDKLILSEAIRRNF